MKYSKICKIIVKLLEKENAKINRKYIYVISISDTSQIHVNN